jgi:hypothetical protein
VTPKLNGGDAGVGQDNRPHEDEQVDGQFTSMAE